MDDRFVRGLGFCSKKDFKVIQSKKILVAGLGGMGGVCAELLIRMGFVNITLADFDTFDITNINRQLYCNENVVGKSKAKTLKKQFLLMNPKAKIAVEMKGITDDNMVDLMKRHDIVVNGIDNSAFSILLRRQAFLMKKPMVDAWLTPAVTIFTINPKENINPEDYMGYPTKHLNKSTDFTLDIRKACAKIDVAYTTKKLKTENILPEKIVKDILNFKYQRMFSSMVWMCGCLMATEVFKFATNKGTPAPIKGVFLNYMDYTFVK